MPKTKDEKQKTRKRMESTIKGKKQKRAKGINKSEPPRRAQKPTFQRVFSPRPYNITTKERKAHASHKKAEKRRFPSLCAYYRKKAKQYKCDTSVLCLYCRSIIAAIGVPLFIRTVATLSFLDFYKKFFSENFSLRIKIVL